MSASLTSGAAPTIVFVSQMGTGGASWKPVTERLTTDARTFTYDRPGTGGAPPRPAPNPPIPYSMFAQELLHELLQADVTEPVVLVGHSVGSLIIRAFAGAYPRHVAGMVHVDGSIPRLYLWPDGARSVDGDTPGATAIDELVGEIQVVNARVPQVPTVVLTRTPGRWDVPLQRPEIDDLWTAYQRQLARQARAPLVVAEAAGHQMVSEAPSLVAYAVDAVVQAVRLGADVHLDPGGLSAVGGWVDRMPAGS